MTIEVRTKIKFQEWHAPSYAVLANVAESGGGRESHTIAVNELDADALSALAQSWLDDLYTKAGKPSPFQISATQ